MKFRPYPSTWLLTVCFLLSASVVSAAEGHHPDSGVLLKDFLFRTLNFVVMFGLLAYFVTKPLRKGLAERRQGVQNNIQDAQKVKSDAEAKFAEYESKLNKASAEIEDIYASIRREGELEREKILANAQEMAEKIKADAERSAANEIERAKADLQREAAAMAVKIAEDLLKKNVKTEDQVRLVNDYMQKVGELH